MECFIGNFRRSIQDWKRNKQIDWTEVWTIRNGRFFWSPCYDGKRRRVDLIPVMAANGLTGHLHFTAAMLQNGFITLIVGFQATSFYVAF